MELADLFKNILGYPLLGKIQKNIVDDLIDVPKWKINVDYAQRGMHRNALMLEYVDPEIKRLVKEVDPVFAKISDNLDDPGACALHYPPVATAPILRKNSPEYLCFLAAYPDVFDYFYPAPDYSKGETGMDTAKEELKQNEQVNQEFDTVHENFLSRGGNVEKDFVGFLIALKNYYRDILKKPFRLARFTKKNEREGE